MMASKGGKAQVNIRPPGREDKADPSKQSQLPELFVQSSPADDFADEREDESVSQHGSVCITTCVCLYHNRVLSVYHNNNCLYHNEGGLVSCRKTRCSQKKYRYNPYLMNSL